MVNMFIMGNGSPIFTYLIKNKNYNESHFMSARIIPTQWNA
jgi:hypothetical protein